MLLCVGFVLRGREALQASAVWGKEGHLCGMKPAGHKPSENNQTTARPNTFIFPVLYIVLVKNLIVLLSTTVHENIKPF